VQINCDTGLDLTMSAGKAISAAGAIKGDIKTKKTDKSIILSGGGVRVTVPTVENSSFPEIETKGDKIAIDGEIVEQLNIASKFAADGDVRPFLNGVNLEDGKVMASNGHCGVILNGVDGVSAIIPKRTVNLMADLDNPTHVSSAFMAVTFWYEWGFIKTQVIAAKYPDMNRVMRDMDNYINPSELKTAVATCKSIGDQTVIIEGNKMTDDTGAVEIDLDGDYPRCSFMAELLDKALSVATEIALPDASKDSGAPAMIKGDHGLIGVVMPCRI
jgi:DNA polymerase III sliding clamp (beta) subunit (PCNA family)